MSLLQLQAPEKHVSMQLKTCSGIDDTIMGQVGKKKIK